MNRSEQALEYNKKGFNCSQSVFVPFRQAGQLSEDAALKLSTVFGGGTAGSGSGICGAVAGALLALSMKYGRGASDGMETKLKTYELGKKYMEEFAKRNGSCICEELLGVNIGRPEGMQKAKDLNLFKEKCEGLVVSAAEILEGMM
jgi:C_GCAxxG_C_C family probable redox protein